MAWHGVAVTPRIWHAIAPAAPRGGGKGFGAPAPHDSCIDLGRKGLIRWAFGGSDANHAGSRVSMTPFRSGPRLLLRRSLATSWRFFAVG